MKRKPQIGDTVFSVHEIWAGETSWKRSHLPYHYVVTEGKITGLIQGGYWQACVRNLLNGEYMCLSFPKFSDFGKSYFWTRREAEELAERITDQYEKTWGWMLSEPLMRPWRE